MVASIVASATTRLFLYVTAHLEQADAARDDLELFSGRPVELLPAWETLPGHGAASGEIDAERLRLCVRLAEQRRASAKMTGGSPTSPRREAAAMIVAPIQALMQPVPTQEMLDRNTLCLDVGSTVRVGLRTVRRVNTTGDGTGGPDALLSWAVERGFERLELVERPGDVARRGDIVDLFAPGETQPYRIHFLGDQVEAIRRFDVSTQRSISPLNAASVTAMTDQRWSADSMTDFSSYLSPDTVVILDEPGEIQTMGETLHARLGDSGRLWTVHETFTRLDGFTRIHFSSFSAAPAAGEEVFDMGVSSVSRFEGNAAEAVCELCQAARDQEVHIVCDNEGEKQRLGEMITEQDPGLSPHMHLTVGVMHRGFEWTRPDRGHRASSSRTNVLVLPHHEVFHRQRPRRRVRRLHAGRPLESWLDLTPGDWVVHVLHGIAIYRGLKSVPKGASQQRGEFLCLEFAHKARVYVPCSQVDLVQKYIGAARRRPKLSTIGGKRWSKVKQQVANAVSDLAGSLLQVQAIRNTAVGTRYPDDTAWQREFEAAFPYEETEDQLIVAGEIRQDLTQSRPMDRLVCGDVGYGKTELAMRAAFKVVEYGRQVCVLVPTTVLAEQHYTTFTERMAAYPFSLACLSRFRSPGEQKKIIVQLKKGQIDIVIGTHRLLSVDVSFSDLGLVVIDEEQRFGVEHKERLKAVRERVDVLTMTATPIPRTLHMALMGIRDISSLQTPPVDRRSIATRVGPFNEEVIRNAVLREMNRDGQVYFVHNYVQSIAGMADTIRRIVPEARVLYAHGQMADEELERVMHRFVHHEADLLVTTTIIESGLDIPSVNTIFINRADRFGLADLHQLRGRVGRSSNRAYCFLLLSPDQPPTTRAAKRLKTIEEFSELGAGFRIAMRDLEIRGAGNLLGSEQSGHIAAVGYEMYCRLLDQAVRRMKNEPDPAPPPVQVDLDIASHIPRHYVPVDRSRIEVYRRMVSCRDEAELDQLERDLVDAYGPFPREVQQLIALAEIRVHARRFHVLSISLQPPDVVFAVDRLPAAELLFSNAPGTVRIPDPKTIHLRLKPDDRNPAVLLPLLRRMFIEANQRTEAPA